MQASHEDEKTIKKAPFKPVYILHGHEDNEFPKRELADDIARFLLADETEGGDLYRLDATDPDILGRMLDIAAAPTLFSSTQVIIVDNAQALALIKKDVPSSIKKPTDDDKYTNIRDARRFCEIATDPTSSAHFILILHEDISKSLTVTKARTEKIINRFAPQLNEFGLFIHFTRLYDDGLEKWIRTRSKKLGIKWDSPETPLKLIEKAGKDLRHLANELDKIASHFDPGTTADAEIAMRLVTSSEIYEIGKMLEYITARRPKPALLMLRAALESGTVPILIIASLASKFRELWQLRHLLDKGYFSRLTPNYNKNYIATEAQRVSPADIAAIARDPKDSPLKRNEFALHHRLREATSFTISEIETATLKIEDVDRRLRATERPRHGNDETMLQTLIVDISATQK